MATKQAQTKNTNGQAEDVATKDETIKLRITAEDVDLIDRAAAHVQLSRSAWLRMVARQAAYRHLAYREPPPLQLDPQAAIAIITGDNT